MSCIDAFKYKILHKSAIFWVSNGWSRTLWKYTLYGELLLKLYDCEKEHCSSKRMSANVFTRTITHLFSHFSVVAYNEGFIVRILISPNKTEIAIFKLLCLYVFLMGLVL